MARSTGSESSTTAVADVGLRGTHLENRSILLVFLLFWVAYIAGIYWYAISRKLHKVIVTLSHAAPSIVALSMTYIFLIMHGATVRQYVSESQLGMDLWALWVDLWPLLLFLTFGAGIGQTIGAIISCFKRNKRRWLPIAVSGICMCALAFFTVLSNFPDA